MASTSDEPGSRSKVVTSVIQSGTDAVKEASEKFSTFATQYRALSFDETKPDRLLEAVVSAADGLKCLLLTYNATSGRSRIMCNTWRDRRTNNITGYDTR